MTVIDHELVTPELNLSDITAAVDVDSKRVQSIVIDTRASAVELFDCLAPPDQERLASRRVPAEDGHHRARWQRFVVRAVSSSDLGLELVAVAHLLGTDRSLVAVHVLAEEPAVRRDVAIVTDRVSRPWF